MKNKYILLLLVIVLIVSDAYTQGCQNLGFDNGLSGWSPYYRNRDGGGATNGTRHHAILNASAGNDPNCGFPVSPAGFGNVLRLGDGASNYSIEGARTNFLVDVSRPIVMLNYALVMTNPGHSGGPYFDIRIRDINGNTVPCSNYNIIFDVAPSDFIQQGGYYYKDWAVVAIDLQNMVGQNVTIEVEVGDCDQGGHLGYAYVDAYCSERLFFSDMTCDGQAIEVCAPVGFSAYTWTATDLSGAPLTFNANSRCINATAQGIYNCNMTTYNGCRIDYIDTIYHRQRPNIVVNSPNVCPNSTVTLTASGGLSYSWSNLLTTPVINIPVQNTSFQIVVRGVDQYGCDNTATSQVTVVEPAQITIQGATEVCKGYSIDLVAQGSQNYVWSTGATTPNIRVTPNTFSSYSVIGTDANGCKDTAFTSLFINQKPLAVFDIVRACESTPFTPRDYSNVLGGTIQAWNWTFGDGSASYSIPNPSHTYPAFGTYTVTLEVTSDKGCKDTTQHTIQAYPKPNADFQVTEACHTFPTLFTATSTVAPIPNRPSSIQHYIWEMGDGTTTRAKDHEHIYADPSTYQVQLIVESNFQCRDTIQKTVTVNPNPVIDFSAIREICQPECTNFINNSTILTGQIVDWNWNFGNGATSVSLNPEVCYANHGVYDITLQGISDKGCQTTRTLEDYITVRPKPVAKFDANPAEVTILHPVYKFIDLSTTANGRIDSWQWDFGDNLYDQTQHPLHQYPDLEEGQTFPVQLIASNNYGCLDTIIQNVILSPDYAIYIPNAFTPENNDVINNEFIPKYVGIKTITLQIFDRWGELVFTADSKDLGWNGRLFNIGEKLPSAIYSYKLFAVDATSKNHNLEGKVILIR